MHTVFLNSYGNLLFQKNFTEPKCQYRSSIELICFVESFPGPYECQYSFFLEHDHLFHTMTFTSINCLLCTFSLLQLSFSILQSEDNTFQLSKSVSLDLFLLKNVLGACLSISSHIYPQNKILDSILLSRILIFLLIIPRSFLYLFTF